LDLVTNNGTKLKIDKTSDDDLSLEFLQNIKKIAAPFEAAMGVFN
jgi:hypothetical protein